MEEKIRLILASASPRRHELFTAAGLPHEILVTDADETPAGAPPEGVMRALWFAEEASKLKGAAAVETAEHLPDTRTFIISADTVVSADGNEVFGKPRDSADAERMLRTLSGRWHMVIGGVTVTELTEHGAGRTVTRGCVTRVKMRDLTDTDISAYITSGEPEGKAGVPICNTPENCHHEWEGKAGAYAIQGKASLFITEVQGDYPNIVGISVAAVEDILKRDFALELTELWRKERNS